MTTFNRKPAGTSQNPVATRLSPTERAILMLVQSSDDLPPAKREAYLALLRGQLPSAREREPMDEVLCIAEVARLLKKTKRTVIRLLNQGHLKRAQFPGRSRGAGVLRSSVHALMSGAFCVGDGR